MGACRLAVSDSGLSSTQRSHLQVETFLCWLCASYKLYLKDEKRTTNVRVS